jgi:hypothetical protein
MVKLKIILSLVLSIAAYFLGIVAEANHGADSAIYMASCFIKIFFYLIAVPLAHSAGKNIRKESNIIDYVCCSNNSFYDFFRLDS